MKKSIALSALLVLSLPFGQASAAGSFNGVILTDAVNPKTTTNDTVKNYSDLAEEYIIVGGEKALPDSTIEKLFK
jgi:hypothetical protein